MEELIMKKLKDIELKENIKILHAVESGSRAWGFASKDSDYDVRFIYVRDKNFYLRLDKTRDVLECQLDNVFDINGWDISKALTLLYKSNPTLFEWNSSPIVYKTTQEWEKFAHVSENFFNIKSALYHYYHIAEKNYRDFNKRDNVKLKNYFYILRAIFACMWISDKKTPPPMRFIQLSEEYAPCTLKKELSRLLDLKVNTSETLYIERIKEIDEYIKKSLNYISEEIKLITYNKNNSFEELNKLFLSLL